jgi:hypothetical protein
VAPNVRSARCANGQKRAHAAAQDREQQQRQVDRRLEVRPLVLFARYVEADSAGPQKDCAHDKPEDQRRQCTGDGSNGNPNATHHLTVRVDDA